MLLELPTRLVGDEVVGLSLEFRGRRLSVRQSGILRTGSAEDSRVYLPLSDFTAWTGLKADTIEIAADRNAEEVAALRRRARRPAPARR